MSPAPFNHNFKEDKTPNQDDKPLSLLIKIPLMGVTALIPIVVAILMWYGYIPYENFEQEKIDRYRTMPCDELLTYTGNTYYWGVDETARHIFKDRCMK